MTGMRLEALRQSMRSRRVDAVLVTHLPHVRYLTGFSGSNAACLITHRTCWFATDPRYATQVGDEVAGYRIIIAHGPLGPVLIRRARLRARARVGIGKFSMSVGSLDILRQVRPGARWLRMDEVLEALVAVKTRDEIKWIRQAASISDTVFDELLSWMRPGLRESEVAAEIGYRQRLAGAEGDAFEPIVVSGVRGALPHGGASEKRLRRGELVTLDFGCRVRGYCSDMTRTLAIGRISRRLRAMYDAVLAAQLTALSSVRAGVVGRDVDAEARRSLKHRKLGKRFQHSLGHGLGLEVHERPRLSPRSGDILEEGHVVTVEPGVYVPGIGGVRIEDDVLVTATGIELLTHSPKHLITLS